MALPRSQRSTTDLLILMVAGTICFAVLATGAAVSVLEIVHPEADTSVVVGKLTDVINTLIGLLAGFLAGRTQRSMDQQSSTEEGSDESA